MFMRFFRLRPEFSGGCRWEPAAFVLGRDWHDVRPPLHRWGQDAKISHAVWLYYRFSLSFREVEEMLFERGIDVTYETIRQWSMKFGVQYARCLKRRQGRLGDTWHLDELFV